MGRPLEVATLGVVVTTTLGVVITDVVATLGATSAYGSIGRISPEGPPYGGRAYGSIGVIEPDGPVANARGSVGLAFGARNIEPELDVVGTEAVAPGCFARSGGTIQRPAA